MQLKYATKKKTHNLFLTRKIEGFYSILIKKHLFEDEQKFREFFWLRWDQFNYVLNDIEEDIKTNPYNRVRQPITPSEKFCYELRLFKSWSKIHTQKKKRQRGRPRERWLDRVKNIILEADNSKRPNDAMGRNGWSNLEVACKKAV